MRGMGGILMKVVGGTYFASKIGLNQEYREIGLNEGYSGDPGGTPIV